MTSLSPEAFAQVSFSAITENSYHHRIGRQFACPRQSGDHIRAGAYSYEQAFFTRQPPGHRLGIFGCHLDGFISQAWIKNARHAGGWQVFESFKSVYRRIRLHRNRADCGLEFLQPADHAGERTARPETRHEMRYASSGLLPDFAGRAFIMG